MKDNRKADCIKQIILSISSFSTSPLQIILSHWKNTSIETKTKRYCFIRLLPMVSNVVIDLLFRQEWVQNESSSQQAWLSIAFDQQEDALSVKWISNRYFMNHSKQRRPAYTYKIGQKWRKNSYSLVSNQIRMVFSTDGFHYY